MPSKTFVAFSSADDLVADTIVGACSEARTTDRTLQPWNRNDPSGQPIDQSVFNWVEGADSFVADVSEPNNNVTSVPTLELGSLITI